MCLRQDLVAGVSSEALINICQIAALVYMNARGVPWSLVAASEPEDCLVNRPVDGFDRFSSQSPRSQ
jgi:hypothetical protein